MLRKLNKYRYWIFGVSLVLTVAFYYCLPKQLFNDSYSTILNDASGQLLSARIASDGQWRFPEANLISKKYEKALLTFEDKHFYFHPGVNPLALGRAMVQNLKAGHVVSGGSTISMQVIRLSRQKGSRHLGRKLIEMVLGCATRVTLQ